MGRLLRAAFPLPWAEGTVGAEARLGAASGPGVQALGTDAQTLQEALPCVPVKLPVGPCPLRLFSVITARIPLHWAAQGTAYHQDNDALIATRMSPRPRPLPRWGLFFLLIDMGGHGGGVNKASLCCGRG